MPAYPNETPRRELSPKSLPSAPLRPAVLNWALVPTLRFAYFVHCLTTPGHLFGRLRKH